MSLAVHLKEHRVLGKATARLWSFRGDVRGPSSGHRGVEIAWVHEGVGSYQIGTREHRVEAGDVVIVPAAIEHGSRFAAGTRCGALEIAPEFLSHVVELTASRALGSDRPFALAKLASCRSIVAALEEEVVTAGEGQVLAVEALVEVLALRLLRQGERAARDPRLARAIELVHERYATELGIDDLAKAAGMSRFHFGRAFRAETGLAPYAYLQRHRLERSADLLRRRRSVTEAAFEVGFRDLGRFARAFRARFGKTPSVFARNAA